MYKDMKYLDIFASLKRNCCRFNAHPEDMFMTSISQDGYSEWIYLRADGVIEAMDIDKRAGVTSIYNTGYIYYEKDDCYYSVSIHYSNSLTDTYEIAVSYCPLIITEFENGTTTKTISA